MEVLGFISAVIIGIILGILGGGGSILSIPVLVYLFHIEPITATAYSFFIVGISSSVGTFSKYKQGLIHLKTAILFGLPALISVFITRVFILPNIPEKIIQIHHFTLSKSILTMTVFALLMIVASFSMIRKPTELTKIEATKTPFFIFTLLQGFLTGFLTGFVGAGGGFLIIPALVFGCRLSMKKAIGTSLLIIAVNSIVGFISDLSFTQSIINWKLLITFTTLTIIGIFIGNQVTKYINSDKLKKGFGWFILVMGIYIIANELMN